MQKKTDYTLKDTNKTVKRAKDKQNTDNRMRNSGTKEKED